MPISYNISAQMQKLQSLSLKIYLDILSSTTKTHKKYSEQLTDILAGCKNIQQNRHQFAIAFYNLAKLSNRYRYLHTCLQFVDQEIVKVRYWLQMLVLASSRGRGSHVSAHQEACQLIQYILAIIHDLKLDSQVEMFAREVIQLIHRPKSTNIISANALNELEMSRKFSTDCPYVTKTFHIADILIIEPIDPETKQSKHNLYPQQQFFHYLVYLSISCFTRATQKFYCHDSSDRDFHLKAIEIASYLYSSKSTYMRFLRRTYREHYLQHLDSIQEVCQYGEIKVKVEIDPQEVPMGKMPWEQEELETEQLVNQSSNIYLESQKVEQGGAQIEMRSGKQN